MPYKQVKSFNRSKAGVVAGMCLKNVRLGFGIGNKYEFAIQAWGATQQHKDRNFPANCDVPLFYSYTTKKGVKAGHINVRLANGMVWSDGRLFANLAQYEAETDPVYLGWGESINGVRVLELTTTVPPVSKDDGGRTLHLNKGTTTTTWHADGSKAGSIYAKDDSYDYTIRGRLNNWVKINSASGGGDGVYVALVYANGGTIPGRYVK